MSLSHQIQPYEIDSFLVGPAHHISAVIRPIRPIRPICPAGEESAGAADEVVAGDRIAVEETHSVRSWSWLWAIVAAGLAGCRDQPVSPHPTSAALDRSPPFTDVAAGAGILFRHR